MSTTGFILNMVKNFNPGNSVLAGGGAAILVYAAGAALVAAGVAIPPLTILGVHIIATAIPITMTMVATAAIPIGHVITAVVPDSVNQQISALAKKALNTIPQIQQQFPVGVNGATEGGNRQSAAAIAMIETHVQDSNFPTGKNGSTESMPAIQTNINQG